MALLERVCNLLLDGQSQVQSEVRKEAIVSIFDGLIRDKTPCWRLFSTFLSIWERYIELGNISNDTGTEIQKQLEELGINKGRSERARKKAKIMIDARLQKD